MFQQATIIIRIAHKNNVTPGQLDLREREDEEDIDEATIGSGSSVMIASAAGGNEVQESMHLQICTCGPSK
jgi:hypothetical protein